MDSYFLVSISSYSVDGVEYYKLFISNRFIKLIEFSLYHFFLSNGAELIESEVKNG